MPREKPEWVGKRPESMPSTAVQLRVLERQGGKCGCGCGIKVDFDRDQLDCDHIVALQDGGENRESNLQILLRKHHLTKTVAENIARGEARRHKAKAFTTTRARKKSSFKTNRDSKLKKRMDGTVVYRSTGEPARSPNRYLEDEGVKG